jgi:hypothetical protein
VKKLLRRDTNIMAEVEAALFEDDGNNELLCLDCEQDTASLGEFAYMVQDAVWAKAVPKDNGVVLCIGCLEKRLGRQLRGRDFKREVLLNYSARFHRSHRLLDRLSESQWMLRRLLHEHKAALSKILEREKNTHGKIF